MTDTEKAVADLVEALRVETRRSPHNPMAPSPSETMDLYHVRERLKYAVSRAFDHLRFCVEEEEWSGE